jgi:2-polyprenyl-3-methyl-5-hydroxy-6-metoxy-1,4-benzoquinol methylase
MRHSTNPIPTLANDPDVRWTEEHPACAVCGADAYEPLVVRNGHQVVRCRQCRLVYVSPGPRSRAPIDALYTDESYSAGQVSKASSAARMREAAWRLDRLERHVEQRGRLLDVGCSAGSFLIAARDRGWDVRGIDVSPAAVNHAHRAHGLDVSVATVEASGFARHSFDVVTVFECIEHMLDPRAALDAAAGLLRDDGVLVITTPNVDGFVPRVTYWTLGRTLGAWEHPTPPHHLYQFSRRTLTSLLHDTGFGVAACETRPMGLRYTVKEMESAIVEALWRRFSAPARQRPGSDGPARGGATSAPRASSEGQPAAPGGIAARLRRLARRAVSALCWAVGLALYAVPVRALGAGDSMIVVARKMG